MIKKIELKNFKSHKSTSLNLDSLTILCGQNGVGKSSLLQSLLLLRQSYIKGKLSNHLSLNKPLCEIGKTKDLLYEFNDGEFKNKVGISLEESYSSLNASWLFDASNDDLDYLDIFDSIVPENIFSSCSLFGHNFQYISALRGFSYENDDYEVLINKQISLYLGKGELVARFLYEFGTSIKVLDGLKHQNENSDDLLAQIIAWEREISSNVNIIPKKVGNSYEIRYSFDVPKLGPTQEYSPMNVGFGLSYTLPLLVAILSSTENAIILIENPEAHLHPGGISKLAELICLASQSGIQIIIETHSDHIINGVLVQCKKYEDSNKLIGINKENVSIYQFIRDDINHFSIPKKIEIEEGGRVYNKPEGFFDQIAKDIRELI